MTYSFANNVKSMLTMAQFMEMNHASTHPVALSVLKRRFDILNSKGFFCVGLRQSDGQWLSLLGGRRNRNVTEIDWQMNREELARYSIGTVIRSYLIEDEIALG